MRSFIAMILCWTIYSCNSAHTENQEIVQNADTIPMQEIRGNFLEPSKANFDSSVVLSFIAAHNQFKFLQPDIKKFYRLRNYSLAWHSNNEMIEQGSILFNRVIQIKDNGILEEVPYLEEFDNLMEYQSADPVQREMMLTAQYFFYVRKVIGGMNQNESRESEWFLPRPRRDYVAMLDSLLLSKTEPATGILYPQYDKLKEKLIQYNQIQDLSKWIIIPMQKGRLKPGDTSALIPKIRKKLFLSHDLNEDNQSPLYDTILQKGIKAFQKRYGLTEDGIIGREVMTKMNEPIDKRIEQIIINMERCRWLSNTHEKEYIVINIPDFNLTLYKNDSAIFQCKVVVGKLKNKTVNFKGNMNQVILNPYWYIPESIMAKEIFPAIKKNPDFLEENDMEWFKGKLRQRPGDNNALGKIKFQLPNSFNIYLHDTPAKSLFAANRRTFSHGCIRLEKPEELALLLLEETQKWDPETLKSAIAEKKEQYISLPHSVPVYIVYFTAFVDDSGKLNFRNDIYGRDSILARMIFSKKPLQTVQ